MLNKHMRTDQVACASNAPLAHVRHVMVWGRAMLSPALPFQDCRILGRSAGPSLKPHLGRAEPCVLTPAAHNQHVAGPQRGLSSLDSSLQLAWCRSQGSQPAAITGPPTQGANDTQPVPILDPYANSLLSLGGHELPKVDALTHLLHCLASRYIDDTLLSAMAATNVNSISKGDYRQIVIVGDGLDTRPFRLPWPEGTLIFLVAPRSVHEAAVPVLKSDNAHVPRGCLMRRVPVDMSTEEEADDLLRRLEEAGFQSDRLSVWVLQGLASQNLSQDAVKHIFTNITNAAAFHSLLMGELPGAWTNQEAQNVLADFGLLSTVLPFDCPAVSRGLWTVDNTEQVTAQLGYTPWLFTGQQLRLSLAQMGVYEAHVAAQDADEDYFENIS